MSDVIQSFKASPKGILRESFKGMEWRFFRLFIGSFLVNFFKEKLTPVLFGADPGTK
jgi:hypothetical protein